MTKLLFKREFSIQKKPDFSFKAPRKSWISGMFKDPLNPRRFLNTQEHGFHILKKRTIAPVLTSAFIGLLPLVFYAFPLYEFTPVYYKYHMAFISGGIYSIGLWFYYIFEEADLGFHTKKVQAGLALGFCLFLASEVMFFFSIFWTFFYISLDPPVGIGCKWPPHGVKFWNVYTLPTINTTILLLSGVTVTLTHQAVILGDRFESLTALLVTIILGIEFSACQAFEYKFLTLKINDSVFGSIFFFSTGFHGLHVIIGTFFLIACFVQHHYYQILVDHHLGLECAIWYWHFVDLVWLFLFVFIYFFGV